MFGPVIAVRFAVELLKLTEFFFKSHPCQQRVDLLLDIGLRRDKRWGKRRESQAETKARREDSESEN